MKENNQNEHLLSVIVPVYNVEQYLLRCIESIALQSYSPIEIIIVDDGSTDGSGRIAEEAKLKYENIHLIHQVNKGLSSARNAGLEMANGDYIAFVDGDDFIDQETYEEMILSLIRKEADIAICGRMDEFSDRCSKSPMKNFTFDNEIVMSSSECISRILTRSGVDISACDKVYRSKLWKDITFPDGRNNEDICTIPYVIGKAKKLVHVPKPFYHYVHREGSITTSYNIKKIKDFYYSIETMTDFVNSNYSELKNELNYFRNKGFLSLLSMTDYMAWKGEETILADNWMENHWRDAYSLRRMSRVDKMLFFLHKIHTLGFLRRINARIKSFRHFGGERNENKENSI